MFSKVVERRIENLKNGTARKSSKLSKDLIIKQDTFNIPIELSLKIDIAVKNMQSRRVRKKIVELLILKSKEQQTNEPSVSQREFETISTDYYKPLNHLIERGLIVKGSTYNPILGIAKTYLLNFRITT